MNFKVLLLVFLSLVALATSAFASNIESIKAKLLNTAITNTDGSLYLKNPSFTYKGGEYLIGYSAPAWPWGGSSADVICQIALSDKRAVAKDVRIYNISVENNNCVVHHNVLFFDLSKANSGLGNIDYSYVSGQIPHSTCRMTAIGPAFQIGSEWYLANQIPAISDLTCVTK